MLRCYCLAIAIALIISQILIPGSRFNLRLPEAFILGELAFKVRRLASNLDHRKHKSSRRMIRDAESASMSFRANIITELCALLILL